MTPKITNTIILAAMALAIGGCTATTGKKEQTTSGKKQQRASAPSGPLSICGVKPMLWLDARLAHADATHQVTEWNDKSGSAGDGHNFSSHPGHRPTRLSPVAPIHFQGNQWLTNSSITALTGRDQNRLTTAPYTTIVYFGYAAPVARISASRGQTWNAPATMIGTQTFQGSSGVGIGRVGANNVKAVYAYINPPQPASAVTRNLGAQSQHMIAVIDDSGHKGLDATVEISLFVDSARAVNFSSSVLHDHFVRQISCIGAGAPASVPTSGNFNEAGNQFHGDIYEVLVFDQKLTPAQIRCIREYLVNKWR